MKVRQDNPKTFANFEVNSFDCFGTLIDWNGKCGLRCSLKPFEFFAHHDLLLEGVYNALSPLRARLDKSHRLRTDRHELLARFSSLEVQLVNTNPTGIYSSLLKQAYITLSEDLSLPKPSQEELSTFGASFGDWPAFPDTVDALKTLKKHYKLVILSNVDRASFAKVLAGPLREVSFDAVYTAEDIGSYKPDLRNFEYLLSHIEQDFSVTKSQVLHTAHSLRADHVPAKIMGIDSAWIARGEDGSSMGGEWEDYSDSVEYTWKFDSMGGIADAVEKDFVSDTK